MTHNLRSERVPSHLTTHHPEQLLGPGRLRHVGGAAGVDGVDERRGIDRHADVGERRAQPLPAAAAHRAGAEEGLERMERFGGQSVKDSLQQSFRFPSGCDAEMPEQRIVERSHLARQAERNKFKSRPQLQSANLL